MSGRLAWVAATTVIAGVGAWWAWRGLEGPPPAPPRAVVSWKGGELLTCMVTVDGASLTDFSAAYNVAMVCGVGRDDRDRASDRAITVSDATAIRPETFSIEEVVSGPMHVLLAELARQTGSTSPPNPNRVHEEALWYELVLLPKHIDTLDVATMADVERLGGRRLSAEPLWTVIAVRP